MARYKDAAKARWYGNTAAGLSSGGVDKFRRQSSGRIQARVESGSLQLGYDYTVCMRVPMRKVKFVPKLRSVRLGFVYGGPEPWVNAI
ncbi:hypothetical protein PHISCL_10834, partial [Aspergillus sclerotialis]